MNVVYILYSPTRNRYYTGETTDMNRRIERHNSGMVKSTASGIPWQLAWSTEVLNRTDALNLEKKIKKRGAKRFLEDRGVA